MLYLANDGSYTILETIDDFFILLEQEMGREIREWLENEIDTLVDSAVEANIKEDV